MLQNPLLAKIPALANATAVRILEGGLTNTNYCVDTPTGKYFMRISHPSTQLLGINRTHEKLNTERANAAGVGPIIVDYLHDEKVLVIEWINARTLHAEDLHQQPGLLPRIARAIQKLHAGPEFIGEFNFPKLRTQYLDTVQQHGYFIPEEYLSLQPFILELEMILASTPEKRVPCNNDLLAENFMVAGDKIWIIDYEYAGQNEASFEIGNLASESGLNDAELAKLCAVYWKEDSPAKIARAKAWSMIARYGWVMWASIQEAVSPIDFDFRSFGLKKWNSVLTELKGEYYLKVLEELKA